MEFAQLLWKWFSYRLVAIKNSVVLGHNFQGSALINVTTIVNELLRQRVSRECCHVSTGNFRIYFFSEVITDTQDVFV